MKKSQTSAQGLDFTSDSMHVPGYFNRVGPGQYGQIKLDQLSGRDRTRSFKFAPDHIPQGYTTLENSATGRASLIDSTIRERNKHRFQDFERAMKCSEIIDRMSQESADSDDQKQK